MIVCRCTVILGVLCIIVLVAAKCTANSVAKKCKILSCPSQCILICRHKCKVRGLHLISKVLTHPVLCWVRQKLKGVPNWMGNFCLSLSPPQAGVMMPLPKKSQNCDLNICIHVTSEAICRINCQALGRCMCLLLQAQKSRLYIKKLEFLGSFCIAL